MTPVDWTNRILAALVALALVLASLLVIVETAVAQLDRPPWLLPYPEWSSWLREHSWNNWIVNVVLAGLVVLGLLLLIVAFRRGRPATLTLDARVPALEIAVSRRSVEKSLAAAASHTTGILGATASVGRRAAHIKALAATGAQAGLRQEVEATVRQRMEALGLAGRLRTRISLSAKESR